MSTFCRLAVRATLAVAVASFVLGCGRKLSSETGAAPSASVISLGIALGSCEDLAACERECEAGSADRCRRLAASYAFGQGGVTKDEAKASSLYERACQMKDPSACMFAGQMSEFARGQTRDEAKAARYYRASCDLQWVGGCYNLAILYERGTGVPADNAKAAELYRRACGAGAASACAKATMLQAQPVEAAP